MSLRRFLPFLGVAADESGDDIRWEEAAAPKMFGTDGAAAAFGVAGLPFVPLTFIPGVDFFPAKYLEADEGASIFFAGVHLAFVSVGGVVDGALTVGGDGSSTSIGVASGRRSA